MKRIHVLLLLTVLFGAVLFFADNSVARRDDQRSIKRVLSHSEELTKRAVDLGCVLIRTTRSVTALRCPVAVAEELNLEDDIRLHADSTSANNQIRANLVHTAGNTGAGRKVVVLDTGYNYNHPELASSYLGGKDFVNDDNDPMDDNGHGTHVAGIVTADTSAKGVAPDAGVVAGKVLDASGSGYYSDIIAGIYWAVDGPDGVFGTSDDFGADAVNLSLGSSQTWRGTCNTAYPAMTSAIQYALQHDVIPVVAAGNSGLRGISLPGCISYSFTVGAVNSSDKVASFSGRGSSLDLVAPGVSIYSTWLQEGYKSLSGTSMATPMVSGVVALVKVAHPAWTAPQVIEAILKTVKDVGSSGYDTNYGWGRVRAYEAVNY